MFELGWFPFFLVMTRGALVRSETMKGVAGFLMAFLALVALGFFDKVVGETAADAEFGNPGMVAVAACAFFLGQLLVKFNSCLASSYFLTFCCCNTDDIHLVAKSALG